MNRHKVREHLFKLIYMNDFATSDMPERLALYLDGLDNLTDDTRWMMEDRFQKVMENIPKIDARISKTAKGWRIDRMSRVDLSILRLAVFELFYDPDIPDAVAINEAVELAKTYGGEESSSFVNGILGVLSKENE